MPTKIACPGIESPMLSSEKFTCMYAVWSVGYMLPSNKKKVG